MVCIEAKLWLEAEEEQHVLYVAPQVRLEKEAEQRIAQLAERAHNEAIV